MRKPKPTISKREASRLVAEAGAKAYEQHGSTGADHDATRALLQVGAKDYVAGIEVRPLTLGVFLNLEALWQTAAYKDALGSLKEAMTLYTYAEPDTARALFSCDEPGFVAACRAWASVLPVQDVKVLSHKVASHLADFYGTATMGDAKKKPIPKPSTTGPGT